MNKFHKLLMTTTAIASILGGNMNLAQAQSQPAYCTGSALGALIGLAITGNARAAASAIPPECSQNEYAPQNPSSPYRRQENYYRQNPPSNPQQLKFEQEMDAFREEERRLDLENLRQGNCLASSEGC